MNGNCCSKQHYWLDEDCRKYCCNPLYVSVQAVTRSELEQTGAKCVRLIGEGTLYTGWVARMKQFTVKMLAFGEPGEERIVDVPLLEVDGKPIEDQLERVFYWGQNDFQPQQHPSVSVGDVVVVGDEYWRVASTGFQQLTQEQFDAYLQVERRDRHFWTPT